LALLAIVSIVVLGLSGCMVGIMAITKPPPLGPEACAAEVRAHDQMDRARWIVYTILIVLIVISGGCALGFSYVAWGSHP